jgi:capsular polysaccharide biosynthesis protein
MGDQRQDLRQALQVLRRHLAAVGILAALGFIAGACFTAFGSRPMPTSTALVALPASTSDTAAQATTATSDPILASALSSIYPAISLPAIQSQVQAAALDPDLLAITARAETPAQAESIASAVAASYVAYVSSGNAPGGQVPARVLSYATAAPGSRLSINVLVTAVLGAAAGALIGAAGVLAIRRSDRRLRKRDEMADAIGLPVLASVSVRHPTHAASWTGLLEDYQPSATDAWRLRTALSDLGLGTVASAGPGADGSSLTVLSLRSDRWALALGPQLAVFAASCGIPTTLVIGPQRGSRPAAGLRAAAVSSPAPIRPSRLRVALADDDNLDRQDAALTVVVAVVDDWTPRFAGLTRTGATVLGVSAGAATAGQLARVAANYAAHGHFMAGILVADPDPADPTTGRLPQLARPTRGPTRMTSTVAVIR